MKITKATAGITAGREWLLIELDGYDLPHARIWVEDLWRWFEARETAMVFMGPEWEAVLPAVEKNGQHFRGFIEVGQIPDLCRRYFDGVRAGEIKPGDELTGAAADERKKT